MKIRILIVKTFFIFIAGIVLTESMIQQTTANSRSDRDQVNENMNIRPDILMPSFKRLLDEGDKNRVLNLERLGLDAYQLNYRDIAKDSFDKALLGIEKVYANSENAARARSLWYEEGSKDFKGEPYERALAYYYRGIMYLEDGDYENARASFKAGIMQDAFAEEGQYRCDFALLIFLEGWASSLAGDKEMSDEAFAEVKNIRPDFVIPQPNNTLLIVETGTSPRKVADGPGHSELKYRRGRNFYEKKAELSIGDKIYALYPIEDIFYQASTRGGRPVDKILKGKAVFRQTHEKVATTLTDVSTTALLAAPVFKNSESIQLAGAALGIFGVAEMAMASYVNPHADIRYWDNLPDTVHIFIADLSSGMHSGKIRYKNERGEYLTDVQNAISFEVKEGKPAVIWLRPKNRFSF